MDMKELSSILQQNGIVGAGGAGFPTYAKLDERAETIILNCAECEPYLTSDYRQMLERSEEIVGGLKVILHIFDKAKGLICIEDNKPEAIAKMQEAVKDEDRIEVKVLKTKYPQGGERTLISAATGRKIYSAKLPADAGCIVDNVSTVIAIYRAVCKQTPLITRVVTLTGEAFNTPINVDVRIGCSHAELVEEGDGFKEEPKKIISGGPMMGFAMFDYHVPVTKTTSALLVLTKDEVSRSRSTACINCGRCVSECPEHLLPTKLATFAEHRKEEAFVKYNGMECCECGCCSYVCPAKRPLVQEIRSMRKMVMANRKKK